MRKSIAELLEEVSVQKKKEDKIAKLRENGQNMVFMKILQWTFDKRIKWQLPEGEVPYNPTKYLDQEGNLYGEARRLYLFVEGGNPNLSQLRRESLFIQLMESLSPKEAKLIEAIKDKKMPYKGITEKLVEEAFPGLINEAQII